jgi:hypothetical protein
MGRASGSSMYGEQDHETGWSTWYRGTAPAGFDEAGLSGV